MRPITTLFVAATLATMALQVSAVRAQIAPVLLFESAAPNPQSFFGYALAPVGDVTADGVPDLLIGAWEFEDVGRAHLVSGVDGAIVYTLFGTVAGNSDDDFGAAVAGAGDVDGDGVPDLLIGARDAGTVQTGAAFVFSGATGAPIHTVLYPYGPVSDHSFGEVVAGAGDTDGDGLAEFAVTDSFDCHLFDGATGALRYTFAVPDDKGGPGCDSYARLGDVTGDGVAEFAIGDGLLHLVHVYDLTTGEIVYTVTSSEGPASTSGFADRGRLAAVGDATGDGVVDFVVGAPGVVAADGARGAVYLFSGADGSLVRTIARGTDSTNVGSLVAALGDLDGDGTPDVLTRVRGSGAEGDPIVVASGATGEVLAEVTNPLVEPSEFGHAIAVVRPADGGPVGAVVAVGAYGRLANEPASAARSRVFVYGFPGPVGAASPPPSPSSLAVSVSPNPSAGAASAALTVAEAQAVHVVVLDALGRVAAVLHDGPASAGSVRLALPAGLAAGVYVVVAEGAGGRASARWVVAR